MAEHGGDGRRRDGLRAPHFHTEMLCFPMVFHCKTASFQLKKRRQNTARENVRVLEGDWCDFRPLFLAGCFGALFNLSFALI